MQLLIVTDLYGPAYGYTVDPEEYQAADEAAAHAAALKDPGDNRQIFEIIDINSPVPRFKALCYTYDAIDEHKILNFVGIIDQILENINATI